MRSSLMFATISLVLLCTVALAQVPRTISYQAVLKDGNDVIVPDGDYDLTFRMYDVSSGGSALWTETQSAAVVRGVFNVILGSSTTLDLAFDQTYWLGVSVEGNPELSPRIELSSSPYSLTSRTVEDGAITGAKIAQGHVVRSVNGLTDDIELEAGSNVTIVEHNDTLTISSTGGGAGDGHSLDAVDGDPVDAVYVSGQGYLGMGTTNASTNIHILEDKNSITGIRLQNTSTGPLASQRIYFDNEQGSVAGIQIRGSGASSPNAMSIFNNRPGGYIGLATAGKTRILIEETGDVGIGTTSPTTNLDIHDNSDSITGIRLKNTNTGPAAKQRIYFDNESGEKAGIEIWGSGAASSNEMSIFNNRLGGRILFATGDKTRLAVTNSGRVGIGTASPTTNIHIVDNSNSWTGLTFENTNTGSLAKQRISFNNEQGPIAGFQITGSGASPSNRMDIFNNRPGGVLHLRTGGLARIMISETGDVGIGTITPQAKLDVNGTTRTDVLTITGGADLAEPFDINGAHALLPGSVVVIDDEEDGALEISTEPYDTRVAGVISGAGGIKTGLTLSQEGLSEGGQNVALSGRIYVRATAANGAIHPGDLLTTSSLPGRAMKATDTDRTRGTVLGKAMSSLDSGEGLVLLLVSLQ